MGVRAMISLFSKGTVTLVFPKAQLDGVAEMMAKDAYDALIELHLAGIEPKKHALQPNAAWSGVRLLRSWRPMVTAMEPEVRRDFLAIVRDQFTRMKKANNCESTTREYVASVRAHEARLAKKGVS